jgi:putative ABC transport system ATP-binding protein
MATIRGRRIGFVFQAYNLLARSTALENVEMPLVYSGVRKSKRRARARAALQRVGLGGKINAWPSQLSGGEQQRVAIARAVVSDPALILADEPTGALDSRTGSSILALFQELNYEGRTVIVVTHDDHVAKHAKRILKLHDGQLVSDDEIRRPLHANAALEDAAVLAAPSSRSNNDAH